MIIIIIIILYFIQVTHSDDFPLTGTLLVRIIVRIVNNNIEFESAIIHNTNF